MCIEQSVVFSKNQKDLMPLLIGIIALVKGGTNLRKSLLFIYGIKTKGIVTN
ncbi:hypothetical protein OD90_0782 [Dokdonia sp. Hel_I_53]|nr:hypothetical protein OD90_0782 [Dokdonia sp. Hel_I_53]